MKTLKSQPLIIILTLVAFSLNLNAQKSIILEYKLKTGTVYDYSIEMDQDISFETNGETMTLDMLMSFETTSEIGYVSPDSINIKSTIDRIKMRQGIFGMEVAYDSDDTTNLNPMAAPMAEEMNKLINASYITTVDNKGNTISMDFSKLVSSNDVAGNLNAANNFIVYPDGKIRVGESWEKDILPLETSDMKTHLKYTLKSIDGEKATIEFDGILSANEIGGSDIKLDGTQSGEMVVNRKTGWIISSVITQRIDMEVENAGMKFPATVSGTVTINSKER